MNKVAIYWAGSDGSAINVITRPTGTTGSIIEDCKQQHYLLTIRDNVCTTTSLGRLGSGMHHDMYLKKMVSKMRNAGFTEINTDDYPEISAELVIIALRGGTSECD